MGALWAGAVWTEVWLVLPQDEERPVARERELKSPATLVTVPTRCASCSRADPWLVARACRVVHPAAGEDPLTRPPSKRKLLLLLPLSKLFARSHHYVSF